MNIKDLLNEESIILDSHSHSKDEAIKEMVEKHYQCGHIQDQEVFYQAVLEREKSFTTGIGNFIAIPHAQSPTVLYPSLVAMISQEGIEFNTLDQKPVHLLFMIAVPQENQSQHLDILAQLCQILMEKNVVEKLIYSSSQKEFLDILFAQFQENETSDVQEEQYDIVAVTACPTGIAHTYMAEKALIEKAKELNVSIKVETNGASGIQNQLTNEDIEKARCVIVAADKKVAMERFHNKPLIQVSVSKAIYDTEELIQKALQSDIKKYQAVESISKSNEKGIRRIYQHLMSGISQIIPILMISGIFMSLLPYIQKHNIEHIYLPLLYYIATIAQSLAVPIMSAFIGDSIAGKPAFIISLISTTIAVGVQGNVIEGILIGFIVGYLVLGLNYLFRFIPKDLQSLSPNLLLPLIGIYIMGVIIYTTAPYYAQYTGLFLQEFDSIRLIVVGAILGMMMSVDLGGPINKTAYTIGIIGIFIGRYDMMSAVMIAGMLPPLIIWLIMLITHIFTPEQRKQKWSCLFQGLCFVSEVAIPYMQEYKHTVHYPCIIASGIAGALTMYFGCGQMFPHGGIWTVFLINEPLYFLLSLIISLVVGAVLVIVMNKIIS